MFSKSPWAACLTLTCVCILLSSGMAMAQVSGPTGASDFGDGVISGLRSLLENYSGTIGTITRQLLFWLLAIDLVINIGKSVITNASLGELLSRFIFRLLFVMFALFVVSNIADIVEAVGNAAVRLARQSSDAASFVEPSVSSILTDGISSAQRILGEVSIWKPVSVFYILCAIVMLVITAVQAAMIVLTYAELYLSSLAGLIVMAFAGLQNAEQSAARYVRGVIGKGLSLLTLLIVFSMFAQLLIDVAARDSQALGIDNLATMLLLQAVSLILMLTLPSSVESLAGGAASSAAARVAGGAVAAAGFKRIVAPVAAAAKGAAAGAAAGAVGGVASGAANLAQGGSAGDALKSAGSGAASAAGRYARSGFSRSKSVASELGDDGIRLAKNMHSILNKNTGSGE